MSVETASLPFGRVMKNLLKPGLQSAERIHYQLGPQSLIEESLNLRQGVLSNTGALVVSTGEFTGRCPKDKFIVRDGVADHTIHWNEFNIPLEPKFFDIIYDKLLGHLNSAIDLWVRDCYACADERYRLGLRVITEKPWSNLFAHNMFIGPTDKELQNFSPEWCVVNLPELKLDPKECGIRSSNVSLISFEHKLVLIIGSGYTGEIKKGVFTILNYVLPHEDNVLSMHCSANIGKEGDTAIFFGLSGTGKTTLSADPDRKLIGDDEHGWTEDNIFNFEGGCYAKCINLTPEREPAIFHAIRSGALVENVTLLPRSNKINFQDASITENTRVSYPLHFIANAQQPASGPVPKNIFFLTCDAFGVLPPISKLTASQAMYQFISGYTAKVAGTENGIAEPKPTFSACFGAPFLPLHPGIYAQMLGKKMKQHNVNVWLINTGWTGGPYGVGRRMSLIHTRAMIRAALEDKFSNIEFANHPVFGFATPVECPDVPREILNPLNTWNDKNAYDEKARYLQTLFIKNFEKYESGVHAEVHAATPKHL
ncbi:MAG TPA: phosphoenolpyruvate carboxykinase (ATP) [Chitinophagaceae bacterium]|nr:phosphoenolpyruvate carboxykinase (ATP) [Chitinophagaceae bacterium]